MVNVARLVDACGRGEQHLGLGAGVKGHGRRLYVREIWIPAAAPLPPTTWNVFPDATLTGCPLNGPHHARIPPLAVRSKLTTAVGDPVDTNEWVTTGHAHRAAGR